MEKIPEIVRKATTLVLAVFLWLHALIFVDVNSALLHRFSHLLRLTTSEMLLFVLLVIFSFLTASGFWKSVLSLAYIYAFPLVLLVYGFYAVCLLLRAFHRWLKSQAGRQADAQVVVSDQAAASAIVPAISAKAENASSKNSRVTDSLQFLLRPFTRFTFLWCILLVVTTHTKVLWLSLIVVLFHLVRKVSMIFKVILFSDPWLEKAGKALLQPVETLFAGLGAVTPEVEATSELKNLWSQLGVWKKAIEFLKDRYLVSSWASALAVIFLGCVYAYIAFLFSFAYYGIARVSGINYSWIEAFITSVFIPFFIADLPKVLPLKALGGLHCTLVVAIGVGTIVNFLRRHLNSLRSAALDISDRLAEQSIQEKYMILEAKFTAAKASPPASAVK